MSKTPLTPLTFSRRRLIQTLGGSAAFSLIGRSELTAVGLPATERALDPASALLAARIADGPCRGAFALSPGRPLVWYFSNLALLPFARAGRQDWREMIHDYLELYLSRQRKDFTIEDVEQPLDDSGRSALARGDRKRAVEQRNACRRLYASDPAHVTCNELGWLYAVDRMLS